MDKKNIILFNNHLVQLLTIVKACMSSSDPKYRDHNKMITRCYEKYKKTDRKVYIEYTIEKMRPHMKYIVEEDDYLFSDEYSMMSLKLLSALDFKTFWEYLSTSDEQEAWRHLKSLYTRVLTSFKVKV